jgi:predicted AlkP superfamily pyrophosphatase or phosphodiesterase
MVSPDFIAGSDFSRAHLGGATQHPYADLDDMLARCGEVLRRPGAKYLYAYWPRLDSLGHRHGIGSTPVAEHLVELDRAFARLLELAEGTDTLILLTADHGQVDPPAHRRIDLADHPALADCLSLPLCGEPRIAYCYLRAGMEQVFDDYVTEHLGDAVLLYTAQELVDSGLFGTGAPHAELDRRVGDRALLMRKDYAIRDWLPHERRFNMVGMHGGLSRDEMLVPLVMADA